jgi:hypothetical protein
MAPLREGTVEWEGTGALLCGGEVVMAVLQRR